MTKSNQRGSKAEDWTYKFDKSNFPELLENQEKSEYLLNQLEIILSKLNLLAINTCECPSISTEFVYNCHVHSPPQQCSATDYIIHNLDSVSNLILSSKFTSNLSDPNVKQQLNDIPRMLYRIFAHFWSNHRDIFNSFESEFALFERFYLVCVTQLKLIPESMISINKIVARRRSSTREFSRVSNIANEIQDDQ